MTGSQWLLPFTSLSRVTVVGQKMSMAPGWRRSGSGWVQTFESHLPNDSLIANRSLGLTQYDVSMQPTICRCTSDCTRCQHRRPS